MRRVKTINIIGAGIAGSLMAAMCERELIPFRLIDDNDEYAASRASSNLFIASWLLKFEKADAASGLAWLGQLFPNVMEHPFRSGIRGAEAVCHIPQRHLLRKPDYVDKVVVVNDAGVRLSSKVTLPGPTVICTGYRGAELVPDLAGKIEVKVGHAYFFKGRLAEDQSRLALAPSMTSGKGIPFRHEKLYQFSEDVIYYADSVAVTLETYKREGARLRVETLQRARNLIGDEVVNPVLDFKIGYRPIVKDSDFGYSTRCSDQVWTINGGGKNGMVAYAFQAGRVLTQLKEVM